MAKLKGDLRLESVQSYEELFKPVRDAMDKKGPTFCVDLRDVTFLNSTAITALARIVLFARERSAPLHMVAASSKAWQWKTVTSFTRMYPGLTVDLQ